MVCFMFVNDSATTNWYQTWPCSDICNNFYANNDLPWGGASVWAPSVSVRQMSSLLWWRAEIFSPDHPPLLTTHVATCWLPAPRAPPRGQGAAGAGCQDRRRGTVGIPSRQAGRPDSNDNEEEGHALLKVCALENVSDAVCHLLCISRTIFCHCLSLWNHLPGLLATEQIIRT